jgi:hypothetical protein
MRVNVKDLAREGARLRLTEVEKLLKPLLDEEKQLHAILDPSPRNYVPSRANGKWRMTPKRRKVMEKMWEGARAYHARKRAEKQIEAIMEAPLPNEPVPEPYLPWTEEELQAIGVREED